MAFLGREREEKCLAAARYLLAQQQPDCAWSNYPDGPADLSVSVKAYFAIKLTGVADPESAPMHRARDVIRFLGGSASCNSFTNVYLSQLGLLSYVYCSLVL